MGEWNQHCESGQVGVYRLYNQGSARGYDSNHRYTSDPQIIAEMQSKGWLLENIQTSGKALPVFCQLPHTEWQVIRAVNPASFIGEQIYTREMDARAEGSTRFLAAGPTVYAGTPLPGNGQSNSTAGFVPWGTLIGDSVWNALSLEGNIRYFATPATMLGYPATAKSYYPGIDTRELVTATWVRFNGGVCSRPVYVDDGTPVWGAKDTYVSGCSGGATSGPVVKKNQGSDYGFILETFNQQKFELYFNPDPPSWPNRLIP